MIYEMIPLYSAVFASSPFLLSIQGRYWEDLDSSGLPWESNTCSKWVFTNSFKSFFYELSISPCIKSLKTTYFEAFLNAMNIFFLFFFFRKYLNKFTECGSIRFDLFIYFFSVTCNFLKSRFFYTFHIIYKSVLISIFEAFNFISYI